MTVQRAYGAAGCGREQWWPGQEGATGMVSSESRRRVCGCCWVLGTWELLGAWVLGTCLLGAGRGPRCEPCCCKPLLLLLAVYPCRYHPGMDEVILRLDEKTGRVVMNVLQVGADEQTLIMREW